MTLLIWLGVRQVGFSNLALFTLKQSSEPGYLYDMSITMTHYRKAVTEHLENDFRFHRIFFCHQVKHSSRNITKLSMVTFILVV